MIVKFIYMGIQKFVHKDTSYHSFREIGTPDRVRRFQEIN